MQDNQLPTKFPIPFGNNAASGTIRPIPQASQIGVQAGAASLADGFPPVTGLPVGSGGTPPFQQDFNGLLNQITAWNRWQAAGGPVFYDGNFSAAMGGYPKGSIIAAATFPYFWLNTVDNNTTNPDAGGAGWMQFSPVVTPVLPPSATRGARSGLVSINDGASPNTKRDISAIAFNVGDSSGNILTLFNVSVIVSSGVSGAGGLDTGSLASNSIYHEWIIAQAGGANPAAVMSLSSSAPTLPAGYTLYGRVAGSAVTDNSRNFYRINVLDREVEYTVTQGTNTAAMPLLCQGSFGTDPNNASPTWVPVSTAAYVPPTATRIKYSACNAYNASTTTRGAVAPNPNYGGGNSNSPPPVWVGSYGGQGEFKVFDFQRESANIYVATASGGTFALSLLGWAEGA